MAGGYLKSPGPLLSSEEVDLDISVEVTPESVLNRDKELIGAEKWWPVAMCGSRWFHHSVCAHATFPHLILTCPSQ